MRNAVGVAVRSGDVSIHAVQEKKVKAADPASFRKRQTVADEKPLKRHESDGRHALHEDAEDVLGANESAVEEREARDRHHEDEGRRSQQPGGVAGAISKACGGSVRRLRSIEPGSGGGEV